MSSHTHSPSAPPHPCCPPIITPACILNFFALCPLMWSPGGIQTLVKSNSASPALHSCCRAGPPPQGQDHYPRVGLCAANSPAAAPCPSIHLPILSNYLRRSFLNFNAQPPPKLPTGNFTSHFSEDRILSCSKDRICSRVLSPLSSHRSTGPGHAPAQAWPALLGCSRPPLRGSSQPLLDGPPAMIPPPACTTSLPFSGLLSTSFSPPDCGLKKRDTLPFTYPRFRAAPCNRTFCNETSHSCPVLCSNHEHTCLPDT